MLQLTTRDREIVSWVFIAGLTTRLQIQALLFSPGARSRCQQRLTMLYRHHFLDRLPDRPRTAADVYYISKRSTNALRLLRASGADEPLRLTHPSAATLQHALDVVACRVQVIRACQQCNFSLLQWLGEDDLRELTGRSGVLPDAYFQIERSTADGERRAGFFVEVERSAKPDRFLREKYRRYGQFYYGGDFERAFGGRALRLLYLVGGDYGIRPESRIRKLLKLAEETNLTLLRLAPLSTFLEASANLALTEKLWLRPGDSEFVSLL